MTVIAGREWSIDLNSPTSVEQAQLLGLIGRRLRANYDSLMDEPLPDRLASLILQLEEKTSPPAERDEHRRDSQLITSD
jgi:hypothetical protein